MPYIIGCDVDDVCCDLLGPWIRWYNQKFSDTLRKSDLTKWDWTDLIKPECGRQLFDYLSLPNYYQEDVTPIEGAREGIKLLRSQGYRVIFITASVGTGGEQKLRWLTEQGFLDGAGPEDYVSTTDKSPYAKLCDVMIDDRPSNLTPFKQGILFSQPWNRAEDGPNKVRSWEEIPSLIAALTLNP